MSQRYMILNYATNTIIRWLTSAEVCAIAKALMAMPNPSFDVLTQSFELVTADYHEMEDGSWTYSPQAREAKS